MSALEAGCHTMTSGCPCGSVVYCRSLEDTNHGRISSPFWIACRQASRSVAKACINNNNNNDDDEIVVKRERLVYTRARRAVLKTNKQTFRLGQYKLKKEEEKKKKKRQQRQSQANPWTVHQ